MVIKKSSHTFFLSPERAKEKPYIFESTPDEDPRFRKLLFAAYTLYFFQKLEILENLHNKMEERDPELYNRLATIFVSKTLLLSKGPIYQFFEPFLLQDAKVSHHRQIFLSHLLTTNNRQLRETGLKLIQYSSVDELAAVVNYCKRVANKLPRSAITAIKKYLKKLETDENGFDLNLLYNKNHLKHLYASLHIKPSARVQNILFENILPEKSLARAIKILQTEFEPEKLYNAIKEYQIPPCDAIKNIKYFSFGIAEKIISKISPEELTQCYPLLKQKGVTKNEDLFLSIIEKIKKLPTKATTKPILRITQKNPTPLIEQGAHISSCLENLRRDHLKITRPIALFIDKSGSMYDYREIGKAFIYLLGNLAQPGNFFVYMFDKEAEELTVYNNSEWSEQFDNFKVDEGGSCFANPLLLMAEKNQAAELICIVSDGNENITPTYTQAYDHYLKETKMAPYTILIKTGYFSSHFEENIVSSNTPPCLITEFTDYETTIREISPMLCSDSTEKILEEIMSLEPGIDKSHEAVLLNSIG